MPNVCACMTTRTGGLSAGVYGALDGKDGLNLGVHVGDDVHVVAENRARLRAVLPSEPAWLTQVHGTQVLNAATVIGTDARPLTHATPAPEADASFTNQADVVCSIMTADCLPVLLADISGKVVAAAHAGWRGLAAGVLAATVQHMREAGAGQIQAWLGPAIGPATFQVGEDVRQAFISHNASLVSAFEPQAEQGKYLADIYALARALLAEDGVTMVTGGDACTVSEPERFYSFRRDGVTGRMATLIWRTV